MEYPKWIDSPEGKLIVYNREEEEAVKDGTATYHKTLSANPDECVVRVLAPPKQKKGRVNAGPDRY